MQDTEKVPILRITEHEHIETEDSVVSEFLFTIVLNGQELVTLVCSPSQIKELTVGFLASEGLLTNKGSLKKITVDERRGIVRVELEGVGILEEGVLFKRLITSGCGRGTSFYNAGDAQGFEKVESPVTISSDEIFSLMKEFLHRSEIHNATGGVHSAALSDTKEILFFSEDIGRHNAIDKVLGASILNDNPTDRRILITTGRIPSEVLFKVVKRNIPIILSKAAPTISGVRLAHESGITLVGFVRGKRMNVYANSWRIT